DVAGIKLNPLVFHLGNLFVHAANVLFVWALLRRIVRDEAGAFVGALVFALHPVQVESVAWVSGMKDLLFGLFSLLAIGQYLAFAQRGRVVRYVLATVAYLLALLSKPTAVMLPLLVWLLTLLPEVKPTGGEIPRRALRRF